MIIRYLDSSGFVFHLRVLFLLGRVGPGWACAEPYPELNPIRSS